MNDLLAQLLLRMAVLIKKVTASYVGGGGLWPMKGIDVIPNLTEVTVTLHEETSSISPFGQPDWHASFIYRYRPFDIS